MAQSYRTIEENLGQLARRIENIGATPEEVAAQTYALCGEGVGRLSMGERGDQDTKYHHE